MKRLALLAALVVLAAGCHFPQGWHWPRTAASGSSTTQTLVYFQNDVIGYQGPYVQWLAGTLDGHPELTIRMVDTCPAGRNCVKWRTGNINGGLTSLATGSNPHIVAVTVTLAFQVGRDGTVYDSRLVVWHEGCHALGGGFGVDAIHRMCNWEHRAHHMTDIARVYHDDPG